MTLERYRLFSVHSSERLEQARPRSLTTYPIGDKDKNDDMKAAGDEKGAKRLELGNFRINVVDRIR